MLSTSTPILVIYVLYDSNMNIIHPGENDGRATAVGCGCRLFASRLMQNMMSFSSHHVPNMTSNMKVAFWVTNPPLCSKGPQKTLGDCTGHPGLSSVAEGRLTVARFCLIWPGLAVLPSGSRTDNGYIFSLPLEQERGAWMWSSQIQSDVSRYMSLEVALVHRSL